MSLMENEKVTCGCCVFVTSQPACGANVVLNCSFVQSKGLDDEESLIAVARPADLQCQDGRLTNVIGGALSIRYNANLLFIIFLNFFSLRMRDWCRQTILKQNTMTFRNGKMRNPENMTASVKIDHFLK